MAATLTQQQSRALARERGAAGGTRTIQGEELQGKRLGSLKERVMAVYKHLNQHI